VIVGFSRHGKGRAGPAVKYLTSPTNPDGSERHPAPVVLRGHPAFIARLIDSLDFAHKYTSGVLSFAEGEDVVTQEIQARIMNELERVAFAGLSREQYAILWVKHTHNPGGRVELNFLIPRCELSSGKSLNIAPPGQQSRELFDTFRSWINSTYGLADPDDISRAQDVSLPHHLAKLKADASRQGEALKADIREAITEYVRREVDAGGITDRAGVEAYLKSQGYEIPRAGKDYLTALDPVSGDRIRLKGALYRREGWNPHEQAAPRIRYGVPDLDRAAELAVKLERLVTARADFHRTRYGLPEEPPQAHEHTSGQDPPDLGAFIWEALGDDTLDPAGPGDPSPLRQRRERQREAARLEREEELDHEPERPGPGAAYAPG
jgi:hypothetical protein